MKKTLLFGLMVSLLAVFTLAGCKDKTDDPAVHTTATVKIMATGTLATGVMIGGIDVMLTLPAGVSVKATADLTNPAVMVTDAGVVAASGVAVGANTLATATYNATPSGVVSIHLANDTGFATGEIVTVICDIAAGSFPTASGFSLSGFNAVDLNGATITGLVTGYTAALQ
jgi:hypothetical protein